MKILWCFCNTGVKFRRPPLWLIGLCGLIGILVDLDYVRKDNIGEISNGARASHPLLRVRRLSNTKVLGECDGAGSC